MHKMLLLVDENFEVFGKDRMKWDKCIEKQIEDFYTFNGFCDSATVGGRYAKALTCKPGTGLVNPYVGYDWDGKYNKEKEIYDPKATKVDVCTIGNMTQPLNDERLSCIETAKGDTPRLEYDEQEFQEYIDRINKKEFDGVLVILDIHF